MTKKDYIAIAKVIQVARNQGDSATCNFIARNLADILHDDNPRFNRVRFLEACGVVDS